MVRSARSKRIALLAAHGVAEGDGIRDYDTTRNWDRRSARVRQWGCPPRMGAGALSPGEPPPTMFLALYMDGISTRRGTVMAALQHRVAVARTGGHLTDEIFARAPQLQLAKSDRPGRFAASVPRLVPEPDHRASLGAAGRRLYESSFDGLVLARRLRSHLDV
jgi:hypothetical protein